MATLINNSGVQYYANKMVQAENRKVGSKSLPTALNDIDSALDEMKILFDTEYGSALDMKLENNENIFSVGTGSGVDKKADVENSFTDVELKGDTLVNLVTTKGGNLFGTSGSSVVTFDKAFSTDLTRCIYTTKEEMSGYITLRTGSKERIKPNTTYTLIFNIFKNNISELQKGISIRGSSDPYYTQTNIANYFNIYTDSSFILTSGIKAISFTTGNDTNEYTGFGFGFPGIKTSIAGQQFEIGDVILLEGDWTNHPLPNYFEGMKSIGEVEGNEIEVSSVGKNLFDGVVSSEYSDPNINFNVSSDGVLSATNKTLDDRAWRYDRTQYRMKLKKGNYTITLETITPSTSQHSQTLIYKKGATDSLCMFGRSTMDRVGVNSQQISLNEDADIGIESKMFDGTFRIQIEKGSQSTTFTPYKLNKKEILLNEPLRGLPNGVKDSIEKINGEWKIVRRCGEIILNGSEDWSKVDYNHNDLCTRIDLTIPTNSDRSDLVCNNIPVCADDNIEKENFYIAGHNHKNRFVIILPNSKLSSATIEGAKEWLSKNNATVIYLLPTPIIEDISPVTLQAWKNGTISIDSVIPVESTHTVALNKPAQIKRNIEELTQLRNKVKSLEEQYDQIALEQAHQLELINHSFELDYI